LLTGQIIRALGGCHGIFSAAGSAPFRAIDGIGQFCEYKSVEVWKKGQVLILKR